MQLTTIILLILLGIILLVLEIFFVPGMLLGTVATAMIVGGIIVSYTTYGAMVGTLTLLLSAAIIGIILYIAFRSNVWKKIAVTSAIDSKTNVIEEGSIKTGDEGKTITRLNPIGKAMFNSRIFEVQALDGFIEEAQEIIVVRIQGTKIWVKIKS